ncbi:MAG: DUF697 domain-containing protein [Cyanobacteria bacterium P01_A01_bin.105]
MESLLKRPILVGGLGLAGTLWLLDTVNHMDGSLALGAIALASGVWWVKSRSQPPLDLGLPQQVQADRAAVEQALANVDELLTTLQAELPTPIGAETEAQLVQLRQRRDAILNNVDRSTLAVALVGNKGVGKTTLGDHLSSAWATAADLSFSEVSLADAAATPAVDSDLVLFVAAGDLTASEQQSLQVLMADGFSSLLILNKQDQLIPTDRALVMDRMTARAQDFGMAAVAAAACPKPIKVRRHLDDGDVQETLEQPAPHTEQLVAQLQALNLDSLRLATALRQARALKLGVLSLVNAQRRQQAMPMIEQMQWIAAGTAFANPLATLDLLAAAAINAQLVMDLGKLYGQPLTLAQAKAGASAIAALTVQLGLVELSTQLLGSALKTHASTYLAGGALQGVSAAYLTRVAGLTLVEFFEAQSLLPASERTLQFDALGDRLQSLFQTAKQGNALQGFVRQALSHLPVAAKTNPTTVAAEVA